MRVEDSMMLCAAGSPRNPVAEALALRLEISIAEGQIGESFGIRPKADSEAGRSDDAVRCRIA